MNQADQTKLLYQQEQLPIFQNRMYATEAEAKACPTGDMQLVEDQRTGLVYNAAFRPELMAYDAHYQNEQALSPLFQEHLESVSCIIDRCMGRDSIVEVGCGKGFFLEMLLGKGFDVTGFDPTYEGSNPRIMKHYFEPGVGIKANGLVLRHVLEHIQDPFKFLLQLKEANGGSGKIYIEVPCFDWICEHKAWFDIFYEHVNYFRLEDFQRMFGKIEECGHVFGGQYLYVVADLAMLHMPESGAFGLVVFPSDFLNNVDRLAVIAKEKRSTIWGGASKGVIFALHMQRAGVDIDLAIDINPAKQGKFMAGSGIRIFSPVEGMEALQDGDIIFVMNSNYFDEIVTLSGNRFNYLKVD